MPEFHALFLLELVLFSGAALAWGFWELWRTDKAIKKTKADEAAASRERPSQEPRI